MKTPFNETELEAYLDEALPAEAMSAIENALRQTPELTRRLAAINARRDGQANRSDLEERQTGAEASHKRRRKYFESSAGYLRRR